MIRRIEIDGLYGNGKSLRRVRDLYTATSRGLVMARYEVVAGEKSTDPLVDMRGYKGVHLCKVSDLSAWAEMQYEKNSPTEQWVNGKAITRPEDLKLGQSYWQGDHQVSVVTGLILGDDGEIQVRTRELMSDGDQSKNGHFIFGKEFLSKRTIKANFEVKDLDTWNPSIFE